MTELTVEAALSLTLVELVEGATPAAHEVVVSRLADKPYLICDLTFPAAEGRLELRANGELIDQAELLVGPQCSGVEVRAAPAGADLTLRFVDLAGQPVDGVEVRSIALQDAWGRGQRRRLKCYYPFALAAVFENFAVYPCCARQWMKGNQIAGDTNTQSLAEIWNGPQYQRMRGLFLEGRYSETCREDVCPLLAPGMPPADALPGMDPLSDEVIHAVNEGQTVMSCGPGGMHHDIDRGCNLDCVMCRDEKQLPNDANVEHALRDIESAISMGALRTLSFSGAGEPLAMRKVVQLLESDRLVDAGVRLSLTTNLTNFNNKLWRRVGHNDFRVIVVSADGCSPEVYDPIRLGGDWKTIAANMRELSRKRRAGAIELVAWNYTVMRSNIGDVGKAIELTRELGFDYIRLIAQLGARTRTNGNMFEDYDLEALDRLHDEIARVGGFDDPQVSAVELGVKDRAHRRPERRLSLAQHIFERRGYGGDGEAPLLEPERLKCERLIGGIEDDLAAGRLPRPLPLPPESLEFLARLKRYAPRPPPAPRLRDGVRTAIRHRLAAVAHPSQLPAMAGRLLSVARPLPSEASITG